MPDDEEPPKLMIFGRDLLQIPCFRRSFLYGISGGLGVGLLAFLCTSRPKLATDVAMLSYCSITLGVWLHCRYEFYILKKNSVEALLAFRREGLWKEPAEQLSDKVKMDDA